MNNEQPKPEGDEATRIWLYLSGGGMRAAFGSLGVMAYLHHYDEWPKVRRVSSVSGGSVANAAIADVPNERGLDQQLAYSMGRFQRTEYRSLVFGVVIALVSAVLGWLLIERTSWPWFLGRILFILYVFFCVQLLLYGYSRARFWSIIRPRRDPGPWSTFFGKFENHNARKPTSRSESLSWRWARIRRFFGNSDIENSSKLLHLFATADMRSGLPTYLVRMNRKTMAVVAGGASDEPTRMYRAPGTGLSAALYASAAWPFIVFPYLKWRLKPVDKTDPLDEGFWLTRTGPDFGKKSRMFVLMDGGLTSTLGLGLDPSLQRSDKPGVMGLFNTTDDLALTEDGDPGLRRIVVDAGQYIGKTPYWWVSIMPIFGAFKTTHRSIKVSLNSQITVDRSLVDDQPNTWFVQLTGSGRHVKPTRRLGPSSFANAVAVGRPVAKMLGRLKRASAPDWEPKDLTPTDRLVDQLRARADKVKLFGGLRGHGLACAASGWAGSYVEQHGSESERAALVESLQQLERTIRHRGGLDDVVLPLRPDDAHTLRWPELDELSHDGHTVAMSHRGVGAEDNTADAFRQAVDLGFKVLECDVQLTRDGELIAMHGLFGWTLARFGKLRWPAPIRTLSRDRLTKSTGQERPRISDLLARFDDDVTWNFEAKRTHSMRKLVAVIEQAKADGTTSTVLISGGWRTKLVRRARQSSTPHPTAAGFTEILTIWAGITVPEVAMVQLSWRTRFLWGRVEKNARAQRIQVHWYGAKNAKQMRKIIARNARVGIIADDGQALIEVLTPEQVSCEVNGSIGALPAQEQNGSQARGEDSGRSRPAEQERASSTG